MSHPPPPSPRPAPARGGGTEGSAHAAPHRAQVPRWALWTGVFAGHVLWSVELLANYAFVAHSCYPTALPRAAPTWGGVWGLALAVSVVATLGTAAAGGLAYRSWRATRDEKGGSSESLLDTAEGRTRFMAMSGMLLSGLYLLTVLATGLPLVMVPRCY